MLLRRWADLRRKSLSRATILALISLLVAFPLSGYPEVHLCWCLMIPFFSACFAEPFYGEAILADDPALYRKLVSSSSSAAASLLLSPRGDTAISNAWGVLAGTLTTAALAAVAGFALLPGQEGFVRLALTLGVFLIPLGAITWAPAVACNTARSA